MKILFFPQNNEHVLNMNPIVDFLESREYKCDYFDTRDIYKQKLNFDEKFNLIESNLPDLKDSFYHLGVLDRIRYVYSTRNILKKLVAEYDIFVFGNDGAIQRLIVNYAEKDNKSTVMILDGLVGSRDYSFKDIVFNSKEKFKDFKQKTIDLIKQKISTSFSGTKFSPYLPSVIGSSSLDQIYTIGNFSKSYIESHKHSSTKVFSFGLPRMKLYFTVKDSCFTPKIEKSICFITSAYKWHNLEYFHKLQIADIMLIHECIEALYPNDEEVKLIIKIHPREHKEDYEFLLEYKNIVLVENEPLTHTFANYTLLFSNISTCIVEGINEGIQVNSLMINFPFWKFKNGFLKNEAINKVFSKKELLDLIEKSLNSKEITYKKDIENDFLDINTLKSVENISNSIIELSKKHK
ncbi:hypothetical protein [Aquimarina aggregata]|uniref:hypothetical protein n=1 Tax=Aquimarina aggregata TaxID=1642818 RepID=UPI0024909159|nr:hypothetical protein [Aquimarina aggregata]